MARQLAGLFGGQKQTQAPATALRVNTSLQGVPVAILLGGRGRMSGNLIDYYGFTSVSAPSSGGGKGGITGGGGKGQSGSYDYFVTFLLAICEGPIAGIDAMWVNGSQVALGTGHETTVTLPDGSLVSYEAFVGDYLQTTWGYTEAEIAAHALNAGHDIAYRGTVYAAFENYPLGGSASLPNLTFEAVSSNTGAVPGQPDGYADVAWNSYLSNAYWGVGFPTFRLGDLSVWRNYTVALGLGVTPIVPSAVQASSFLNDLLTATNSAACWEEGLLTVEPYGDAAVTAGQITAVTEQHTVPVVALGNWPSITVGEAGTFAGDGGVAYQNGTALTPVTSFPTAAGTYYRVGGVYWFAVADANQPIAITYDYAAIASYQPSTTPLYDFTLDDFLPQQGTIGQGLTPANSPLTIVRTARDQMLNVVKVEYLDRTNNYNPVVITARDEASITMFKRERPGDIRQLHLFCLASAAQQSAQLQLIRQQIPRKYQWTCGRHFALIQKLMGVYTVTDPGQNVFRQAVRLIEVQENQDFSLTWTAEEYLGTMSAPQYGSQAATGYAINYNADPGSINPPILFEPTDELGGGLAVWAALSGINEAVWGGCEIWVTYDGETYQKVGTQYGPARMGVLSAGLGTATANPTGGPTIDQVGVLSVNLSESDGELGAGTNADAVALNTRCYVGGEIIAYANAALTAPNQYALSYLVRGAYGTEDAIAAHAAGTAFARLDAAIFALAYDQSRIGSTIYLKFPSFNIWQGGLQSLANVPAYPFTLTGSALASPLPTIQNLRTVFDVNTGFQNLDWDEITDFRAFKYEVRSGASASAALTLGQVAHPPFRVPGDGTYWVAAIAQPVAGLTVYSETWSDVAISGAVITANVVLSVDLKAANWPGTFTGGAGIDTSLNAIRTGGANILSATNILTVTDILNYGGGSSGIYYPSGIALLDIGYVANASVAIKYQPTGVPVGQNILAIGDVLGTADILGSAATQFINVFPQINTATQAGGDLYSVGDLYSYPDLYAISDIAWNGWQSFSPGTYQTRYLEFAMVLETIDPNTVAYDLAMTIEVTIPSRIDQLSVATTTSGSTAVTFQPNGAGSAAPFNGGPGSGNTPVIQGTIRAAQAGDLLVIGSLTVTGCTVEVVNGGSPVARTVDLTVQGY